MITPVRHQPKTGGDTRILKESYPAPLADAFGTKPHKPLTNILKYLKDDMRKTAYTVHGFRSTFRDWVGDCTDFARDLAEMSLAHTLPDKTEAAYRRQDALQRRRVLMDAWADYCAGRELASNILPLKPA